MKGILDMELQSITSISSRNWVGFIPSKIARLNWSLLIAMMFPNPSREGWFRVSNLVTQLFRLNVLDFSCRVNTTPKKILNQSLHWTPSKSKEHKLFKSIVGDSNLEPNDFFQNEFSEKKIHLEPGLVLSVWLLHIVMVFCM